MYVVKFSPFLEQRHGAMVSRLALVSTRGAWLKRPFTSFRLRH